MFVVIVYDFDFEEVFERFVELGLVEWKEDKFKYEFVKNKE